MKTLRLHAVGALLLLVVGFAPGPAAAASIMFKDKFNIDWTAEWTSNLVGLTIDPSTAAGTNIGTFIKTVTFVAGTKPEDVKITFKQVGFDANNARFGLRFTLQEFVRNRSGKDWKEFEIMLVDKDPNTLPAAGDDHPGFAHFHTDGLDGKQLTLTTVFDTSDGLTIGKGLPSLKFGMNAERVANGEDWTPIGIGFHEITLAGMNKRREFSLLETPVVVPLPAALPLFGSGALGLIGCAWRRRRADQAS